MMVSTCNRMFCVPACSFTPLSPPTRADAPPLCVSRVPCFGFLLDGTRPPAPLTLWPRSAFRVPCSLYCSHPSSSPSGPSGRVPCSVFLVFCIVHTPWAAPPASSRVPCFVFPVFVLFTPLRQPRRPSGRVPCSMFPVFCFRSFLFTSLRQPHRTLWSRSAFRVLCSAFCVLRVRPVACGRFSDLT